MSAGTRIVLRDLGLVLHVPGLMACVSLPVCLLAGETYALLPFGLVILLAFGIGQGLFRLCRGCGETRLVHGMVIAALGWFLVPVLGAIPIGGAAYFADASAQTETLAHFRTPLNALFESFSGFTGTGLTVAMRPADLPHGIQWWRSLMEWVGGVGVIVLMLSIIGTPSGAFRLYYSEAREEKILPSVGSTVRMIWWVYLAFTAGAIVLLLAAGVAPWEALNHGMTGIATGGFVVTNEGVSAYPPLAQLAFIPIMLAGACSFTVHYRVVSGGGLRALWADAQHRLLYGLAAGGAAVLVLERMAGPSGAWLEGLFQWVSALTTCGFQTADLNHWATAELLLLCAAMIIGGAGGSTVGGIKMFRLAILLKAMIWRFQAIQRTPNQVMRYKLDGTAHGEREAAQLVEAAAIIALLWVATLWAGTFVLAHVAPADFGLDDVALEVASAQGNVGLSTGLTAPGLHPAGKCALMALMWMGRLEIVPILVWAGAILRRLRLLFGVGHP